jgi:hypothetical protein
LRLRDVHEVELSPCRPGLILLRACSPTHCEPLPERRRLNRDPDLLIDDGIERLIESQGQLVSLMDARVGQNEHVTRNID